MKTLNIIQARMGSTRLPGKVLEPIYKGMCVIDIILEKLKGLDNVLVVPSGEAVLFNQRFNVPIIGGSETNVFSRFITAIEHYKPQVAVRICADNCFIDRNMVTGISEKVRKGAYYASNWHDVEGTKVEAFDPVILLDIAEHTTIFFRGYELNSFDAGINGNNIPDLALDTPEDLKIIKKIFKHFNKIDITIEDLGAAYKTNRRLFET